MTPLSRDPLFRMSNNPRGVELWLPGRFHPACPPFTIRRLSQDPDHTVRAAIARSPACPPRILQQLGRDGSREVRICVTSNPSCPLPTLKRLLSDPVAPVARNAADNPAMPDHIRAMWQLAH